MKYFFLFIVLFPELVFSQEFLYKSSIGKFKDASAFDITSAGIIYVTDAATDEIYKLDTLGNVMQTAGGYGWSRGLFDNPSGIFANPLSVYVSDKNNNRIERFDKDLNYISQLNTRNSDTTAERFGYPLGCVVSPQGDLYILDSENKRVVEFDMFGNFSQNFGGYNAGKFALYNPLKIAVAPNNDIYVVDGKRIVVFDQYGTGLSILNTDLNLQGMNIIFNNLTLNTDSELFYSNINSNQLKLTKIKLEGFDKLIGIVSSLIFNQKLYVLTGKEILIFNIVK